MLLPVSLGQGLVSAPPTGSERDDWLTPAETAWLRALALGQAVGRIAMDSGLSERTMYRRLTEVFDRIGVAGRSEASAWAWRNGYLTDTDGLANMVHDTIEPSP